MDVLSLVAKLVLDKSDYDASLTTAETQARTANVSVSGSATLEHAEFDESINTVNENTSVFEQVFTGAIQGIKDALLGAGIVATINKIGSALQAAISNTAAYADQVDKAARRMSISTDAYQVWQHVLSQSGANLSDVTRGWQNLTNAIDLAKTNQKAWAEDTGDVKKALADLGIDPAQASSVESLFDTVVTALSDIESGTRRDTLVTALFGRGGTQLNALLDSGRNGIRELKQEAYDLGLVMSAEDIESGVAYGDAIANMNSAVEALKQNLTAGLFPILTDSAKMLTSIISFFNGRTTEKNLQTTFAGIDQELDSMFENTSTNEAETKSLVDVLFEMQEAASNSDDAFAAWVGTAQKLIEKCPELASSIDLTTGSFTKSKEEIYKDIEALTARAKSMALQNALSEKLSALTLAEKDAINAQIDLNLKRAQSEAATSAAITKANELLKKYGITYETFDTELGDFVTKDSVQTLADVNNALAALVKASGVDSKDTEGLSALTDTADSAETSVEQAESALDSMRESITAAEKDYADYATAVQTMIDELTGLKNSLDAIPDSTTKNVNVVYSQFDNGSLDGSHASGLNYVPFDGYIAELHRGETILNQAQGREWRQNNSGINQQALYSAVASAVAAAVSGIQINMDGRAVGNAVTDQVSRNIYRQQIGFRSASL